MGCECLGKCVLIVINIFFTLIGLAFLAVGVLLQMNTEVIATYVDPLLEKIPDISQSAGLEGVVAPADASSLDATQLFQSFAVAFIVMGVVITLIGFLGFCGACCNIKVMLVLYSIIVGLLLVVKLVAVILLFLGTFTDEMKAQVQKLIDSNYGGIDDFDSVDSILFNYIMINFECCGIDGYEDFSTASEWERERNLTIGDETAVYNMTTPIACCKFEGNFPDVTVVEEDCSFNPMANNSNYETGCWEAVGDAINTQKYIVIGVIAAILAFELMCIIFAILICKKED